MKEKEVWELDGFYRAASEEQDRIQQTERAVSEQLTRIALQKYPGLLNLNSERIRRFGDLVSRTACDFAMKLESLATE
jgi:hypothetical protein